MRATFMGALINKSWKMGGRKSFAVALGAASIPALLASMAAPANAADLSYKDERPAIMGYSGGSWAGGYFGAHAGWSGADNSAANPFIDRIPGGAGNEG